MTSPRRLLLVNGPNLNLLGAEVRHLPGCHLVKRDRENWYAFTAAKAGG